MFSRADISNGRVIYTSTSSASSDDIIIKVSDRSHDILGHIRILVTPVDSGNPTYGKQGFPTYHQNETVPLDLW